jgi:hypothetical protein
VAEHSIGQVVAYLTVCEILADASTGADGVLWCERSSFYLCGFATLGFIPGIHCFFQKSAIPILAPGFFFHFLLRVENITASVIRINLIPSLKAGTKISV